MKATEEDVELNLARILETREDVDAVFGSGMWRPLPRHMIFQDGRPRSIDDAKKGLHNWFSTVCETIVCASAEWPAVTIRALLKFVQRVRNSKQVPTVVATENRDG